MYYQLSEKINQKKIEHLKKMDQSRNMISEKENQNKCKCSIISSKVRLKRKNRKKYKIS